MDDAIARQPVVILPTGSTEQHGRHLPLDVDLFLTESICHEVGRRAGGNVLARDGRLTLTDRGQERSAVLA